MAKIVIDDLNDVDVNTFPDFLTSAEVKTVLGGYGNVYIMTVHDGINSAETNYEGPYGSHDNNYYVVDNSDQVYIWSVFSSL